MIRRPSKCSLNGAIRQTALVRESAYSYVTHGNLALQMAQKLNIIVVDDEPIVSDALGAGLERRGQQVRVAGDGQQGLAMLKEHGADVLITDVCMPGKSGIELVQDLHRRGDAVKVIVMTAFHMHEGIDIFQMVKNYGVDGVLEKPIILAELFEMIDGFFADSPS